MPPDDRVKRVPVDTIRSLFNGSQYPDLIRTGNLIPQELRNSILQKPRLKGEPPGTRSQVIRYLDGKGQWVVEVHQYLRPNGTLGGSGKPDPKRLRIGDTVYIVNK